MSCPLVVHLIFHPASGEGRRLAEVIDRELNSDPVVPGLRIPTVIVPQRRDASLPPPGYQLDGSQHAVAVVLADDELAVEPVASNPTEDGWPAWVARLREVCGTRHRFLPFQLSEAAWPLDERLCDVNFVRAFHLPPGPERDALIVRRIVIELCRFLHGLDSGTRVPFSLFLSHAKQDIDREPKVFHALTAHLDATQPIDTWIDSAEIEAGSRFDDAITAGASSSSALLVLATRSYSSRPWCRREVLLAKEHGRPIVVIDALQDVDPRAFPYLGNIPVVPWIADGGAAAVDTVLKEILRHLHTRRVLAQKAPAGTTVLVSPPELATLVHLPSASPVLYPDPPLGDEELLLLGKLGHALTTPLQRVAQTHALADRKIALSISESTDPEAYGVLPVHVDRALLELSRYLLAAGAVLVYGGHLGKTGYAVALFDLVAAHRGMSRLPPPHRIINYIAWPLPRRAADLALYQRSATYRPIERPDGVADLEPAMFVAEPTVSFPPDTPARRYARARGMTLMRERQTEDIAARIVLGGKSGPTEIVQPDGTRRVTWYLGRIPGVIEEAWLTFLRKRPLYVCGGFGGAGAMLADLLRGRPRPDFTWDYQRAAPHGDGMRALYDARGPVWQDYAEMTEAFASAGVGEIAEHNGLSVAENDELFETRDVSRLIELVTTGLARALSRPV